MGMGRSARWATRLATAKLALAALVAGAGGAAAIEGGTKGRSGDQLARATVAVGIINRGFGGTRVNGCSGVLIAPDRVMTAAHCVAGSPTGAAVFTYQGSERQRQATPVTSISRRSIPIGNAPASITGTSIGRSTLDVAILQLQSAIPGRAPLPLAGNLSAVPARLKLAGVGLSEQRWGTLKTTDLRTLYVTDTGLTIAQVVNGQACTGDSGGPVVIPGRRGPVLWGVVSIGIVTQQTSCSNIVVIAPASLVGASL